MRSERRKRKKGVELEPTPDAGYRVLEHTADVGVAAWGPTPADAFTMASLGMFEVLLDADPRVWHGDGRKESLRVEAQGAGWSDLLVNWLAEFVYRFDVEGFVPQSFDFAHCEPPTASAEVAGVIMRDPADTGGTAIKAVTYHQLSVDVSPGRTALQVIFDI